MSAHKDRTAINSCGPTHTVVPNWLPLPICCWAQKMPKKRQLPSPLQFVLLPMLVESSMDRLASWVALSPTLSKVSCCSGSNNNTHTKNLIPFPKIVSSLPRTRKACVHRGVWLEPPLFPFLSCSSIETTERLASRVCSLAQITMRHRKGCSNYPGQEGPNNRATADHLTRVQPFATT